MISNKKKALIHVAKKQVALTEEEYRSLLARVGVESSRDLNNRTFNYVMDRFNDLGFRSKKSQRKISNLPHGKKALMKKLMAIILDMKLSWAYVDSISKSRFKVETAQWLDQGQLRKLVQIMVVHQKRTQTKVNTKSS